jgi:hypothetical protein
MHEYKGIKYQEVKMLVALGRAEDIQYKICATGRGIYNNNWYKLTTLLLHVGTNDLDDTYIYRLTNR